MKKEELRKMIKELMQEVLGETETSDASEETLDERGAVGRANKQKKKDYQMAAGRADLDRKDGPARSFTDRIGYAELPATPGFSSRTAVVSKNLQQGRRLNQQGRPAPGNAASIATSPTTQDALRQRSWGRPAAGPTKVQAGGAAEKAAQAGLKKIPGTFGLYSKTGAPPAEFRSSKGQLVPVKSASGKLTENNSKTSTRLVDLIAENSPERRVNLIKVQALMEKIYPELTAAQSKKLMEMCKELHEIATHMNHTRYIRTESSLVEWKLIVAAAQTKVQELKEEVEKLSKKQKEINFVPLVKALDEVFVN